MSTGRLVATVQSIQFEFLSEGTSFPASNVISRLQVPFGLEPTQMRDIDVDPYDLAAHTKTYGGTYQWQVSVFLGDGREFQSSVIPILHPPEPRMEEMLTSFNLSIVGILRELNMNPSLPADRLAVLSEAYTELRNEFPRLRSRFDQLERFQRTGTMANQIVNAEQRLKEVGSILAQRSL